MKEIGGVRYIVRERVILCPYVLRVASITCPFSINLRSKLGSRDSVVGIATSYRLDDRGFGVQIPVGVRIFTSPGRPDRLWG
jgi:hypothetical protein